MKRNYILYSILCLVIASCISEEDISGPGSIEGKVLDEANEPVVNASVRITGNNFNHTLNTDSKGIFSFVEVPPGDNYLVVASHPDYFGDTITTNLLPGLKKSFNSISDAFKLKSLPPIMSIPDNALNFGATETELILEIRNDGKSELIWQIENTLEWLSFAPSNGTTTKNSLTEVIVRIDRDSPTFSSTSYDEFIPITSINGGEDIIQIKASFPTMLEVSTTTLSFTPEGASANITLKNSGGGTLTWSLTEDIGWLTVSSNEGTIESRGNTSVELTVTPSDMPNINNTGILTITGNGGTISINVNATRHPNYRIFIHAIEVHQFQGDEFFCSKNDNEVYYKLNGKLSRRWKFGKTRKYIVNNQILDTKQRHEAKIELFEEDCGTDDFLGEVRIIFDSGQNKVVYAPVRFTRVTQDTGFQRVYFEPGDSRWSVFFEERPY